MRVHLLKFYVGLNKTYLMEMIVFVRDRLTR
jgi:hypothetical protein